MHKRSLPGFDPLIRFIEGEDGAEGGNPPAGDGPPEGGEQDGTEGSGKADGGGSGDGGTTGKGDDKGKAGDKAKPEGKPADDKGDDDEDSAFTPAQRKYVKRLREEAIKARKAGESEKDNLLKGLRALLDPEGAKGDEVDPVKLAETAAKERDDATARAAEMARELAVVRSASGLGVDGDKLLDSRSFERAVAELDPAAEGFAGKVRDLIKKAAEKDPTLKVKAAPAPPQSGPTPGGEGSAPSASAGDAIKARRDALRKARGG